MKPKNLTPEAARDEYAAIVADVKASFAKKPPRSFAGAEVTHAIQKRWAKRCGEPFEAKTPAAPTGNEPVATVADRSNRGIVTKPVDGEHGTFEVPVGKK